MVALTLWRETQLSITSMANLVALRRNNVEIRQPRTSTALRPKSLPTLLTPVDGRVSSRDQPVTDRFPLLVLYSPVLVKRPAAIDSYTP